VGVELSQLLEDVKLCLQKSYPSPVWVHAEITKWRETESGYINLELAQYDDNHVRIAHTQAEILPADRRRIVEMFEAGTQLTLNEGIKVLVRAKPILKPTFGLVLRIDHINPSFTVGAHKLKLRTIRGQLTAEGIFERNRLLAAPTEFCRVAVLSPEGSAGLEDFQQTASALQERALCHFEYYSCTFQGSQVAINMTHKLQEIRQDHMSARYDALVIIRGGGAATTLYDLDEYDIARIICEYPMPVITGIGHQRDTTILDEVANQKFDTPSKVIHHIWSQIAGNALQAKRAVESISLYAQNLLVQQQTSIDNLMTDIRNTIEQRKSKVRAERTQSEAKKSVEDARAQIERLEKTSVPKNTVYIIIISFSLAIGLMWGGYTMLAFLILAVLCLSTVAVYYFNKRERK
jgi:exodeoxyribonuclease VII large subunit